MNGGGESAAACSWRMISWSTTANNNPTGFVQDLIRPTITNRVMLRFRPIAPKPAATGAPQADTNPTYKPRKKRKYVRVRKSNNIRSQPKRKDTSSSPNPVVTLQLLPETSHPLKEDEDRKKSKNDVVLWSFPPRQCNLDLTVAGEYNNNNNNYHYNHGEDPVTWVAVETASEIPSSALAYHCMDPEEVKIWLGGDKCPGFVTDGCYRVEWVNGAYKRMKAATVRVGVVMKDEEVAECFGRRRRGGAYTCWVRVRGDTWRKEMVPCDAWRLENGGLAWRLDVEAGLTLGPG